ncbi:hypothetical protein CGGC5_v000646 [Colletotrichum fructicola Nara gc5]|uniref:Uncharacterized protein n=1 Tax=Colletotrichum fructicola (strain Nara gc5) TaxID=1213859 RepID=A0A7J6JN98_COLFN|nr:hypothetical protein CGGC5_v000646 [Colletotrichum fructicola Nara gc5]
MRMQLQLPPSSSELCRGLSRCLYQCTVRLSEHRANHSSAPPRPLSWASISITTESPAWNLAVHLSEACSTRAILPFRSAVKEALPWTYSVAAPIQNHLHPQGTDLLDLPLLPSDSWSRQI